MDDLAYERRLNRRAVIFGLVLIVIGLAALGVIGFALELELPLSDGMIAFGAILSAICLGAGAQRVWRGRAPDPDAKDLLESLPQYRGKEVQLPPERDRKQRP